jgi:hypothetical protein
MGDMFYKSLLFKTVKNYENKIKKENQKNGKNIGTQKYFLETLLWV